MCLTMEELNGIEIISAKDSHEWETWLADHHERQSGVWLKTAKKHSGILSVTDEEALDVALCYGWIDSIRKSYDQDHFLQKYSRRRPKGAWSKRNIDKVEALVAAGRMRPPGLAEIVAAKANGRWDAAYESQKNATVPPDLAVALEQNERAKEFFGSLTKTNQYALILRLMKTRTTATRTALLQRILAMLEAGEVAR